MTLRAVVVVLAVSLSGCSGGDLTRAEVASIEAGLEMPEGASPLVSYARFYSAHGTEVRGEFFDAHHLSWMLEHRAILAQVSPTVFIVDENNMPGIRDGGCGVLTLTYDTQTRALHGPVCNGSV